MDEPGTYVVGTSVVAADGSTTQGTALASQSYGREYEPGAPDGALLARVAEAGAGRAGIEPSMAFDPDGLSAGRSRVALARWLLLAAALLFVAAVVLSRLTVTPFNEAGRGGRRPRAAGRARPGEGPADPQAPDRPRSVAEEDSRLLEELAEADESARSGTVSALLERTRERRRRDQT